MTTRIDHATVITCHGDEPVVLEDTSIEFDQGVITHVGPTGDVRPGMSPGPRAIPPVSALRGRPLGRVLIKLGMVTRAQVDEALARQRATYGVIGQMLVDMGHVSEENVELALALQAGREPVTHDVELIDGRNKLVVPGLINTHHHLYQSLTRCMPTVQNAKLFDWLTRLYPYWQELTCDDLKHAAAVSIAELLLGGCTTTSDHMYLFPADRDVKLEAVLEAAGDLGIRVHACRGSMSLSESSGGLPPDACVQCEDEILADCRRVIDAHHDPRPMAMRRIDLAPCSPFSITPELLDQTRALAAERNVLLHTHAAETLDEERFCLDKFGVRPIGYLHQHGWLAPNVYLAHCVHLDDGEIRLLADTGTGVTHCPCSNMRLGSGIAPVRRMLDAGVKVGLAVDGSSSNDGGNLLAEARQALLLQRVGYGADAFSPADAFRMATIGGAAVLGRTELGRVEAGCAADLVVYDANDVAFAGAFAQDPLGALLLCCAPRPERVIVAGSTVVEHGRVTGVDLPKLVADFNQLVRKRFQPTSA